MGKNSKKIEDNIKYSYLTINDLKKLENKGLELTEEIRHIDFIKDPETFKLKSLELHKILTVLSKYKNHAKD